MCSQSNVRKVRKAYEKQKCKTNMASAICSIYSLGACHSLSRPFQPPWLVIFATLVWLSFSNHMNNKFLLSHLSHRTISPTLVHTSVFGRIPLCRRSRASWPNVATVALRPYKSLGPGGHTPSVSPSVRHVRLAPLFLIFSHTRFILVVVRP